MFSGICSMWGKNPRRSSFMKLETPLSVIQARRSKGALLFGWILLLVGMPAGTSAQIVITEIMYDTPGADSNKEWVEIRNMGTETVDLTDWKFFEANTNHALTIFRGSSNLASGAYAIIAQKAEAFLSEWPSASVPLFDSSFSLGNEGEDLGINLPDGSTASSITYTSGPGAMGDGNSLQIINGVWKAGAPTPGKDNTSEPFPPSENNEEVYSTPATTPTAPGESKSSSPKPSPSPGSFSVDGGSDLTLNMGVDHEFKAESKNLPASSVRYVWSMGNGATKEGPRIVYRYDYEGEYVMTLTSQSGDQKAEDRFVVRVEPVSIFISEIRADAVILKNDGKEIDVSGWSLRDGAHTFIFPPHTIVLSGKTLPIPGTLSGVSGSSITFHFPNGSIVPPPAILAPTPESGSENPPKSEESVSKEIILAKAPSEEKSLPDEEPVSLESSLAASPIEAGEEGGKVWYWILGLIGVVALGAGAVFMLRQKEEGSEADSYTIIEKREG